MTRFIELLQRIARLLVTITLNFCILLAACMCLALLAELIARNLMDTTLIWSAELATICFVWIAFLGSTAAARQGEHFSVDLLGKWAELGSKPDHWLKVLTAVVIIGFGAVFLVYGIAFVEAGLMRFSFSLGIPQGYTMIIMPISGALFLFYGLLDVLEIWVSKEHTNVKFT